MKRSGLEINSLLLAIWLSIPAFVCAGDSEHRIPIARDGSVACQALFDSVSEELHWVAGSITAFTKSFGVETEAGQRLPAERVDELVQKFPSVFSREREGGQDYLVVHVEELAGRLADRKSQLRGWLAELQDEPIASLEKVDETWRDDQVHAPRIIVVMAGLHGVETTSTDVAKRLHEISGLPTMVFSYPNDAPIAESAGLLAMHLRENREVLPSSNITLVTHSMGGLVSRCAIEMDADGREGQRAVCEATGVDQLVMICPPNHGSALAEYGPLLEAAEKMYRIVNRNPDRKQRALFSSIVDGFNEASRDLEPDSDFLTALNACRRNAFVRYTVFAGTDGPLRGGSSGLLSTLWSRIADAVDEPAVLDSRIRQVLECAELQKGQGDGVVTLDSARLEGVQDFVVLPMHHLVWNETTSRVGKQLMIEVASRIGIAL